MSDRVTVVNIVSLSYTGTTWLNTILGCHPRTFALGPGDRFTRLTGEPNEEICRVHGPACPFWTDFMASYDESKNFFRHLAAKSGKDIIVTNNVASQFMLDQLNDPQVQTKQINIIRDGRAIFASYMRKYPDTPNMEALTHFLEQPFNGFYFDQTDSSRLCYRYEDTLEDTDGFLQAAGKFLGLEFADDAIEFWKHPHHHIGGNAGPLAIVRLGQGIAKEREPEFYADQWEALQQDPVSGFKDERWPEELTQRDLFLFELYCGEKNAAFGYSPSQFSMQEVSEFSEETVAALSNIEETYWPKGTRRYLTSLICEKSRPPDAQSILAMLEDISTRLLCYTLLHRIYVGKVSRIPVLGRALSPFAKFMSRRLARAL